MLIWGGSMHDIRHNGCDPSKRGLSVIFSTRTSNTSDLTLRVLF